MGGRLARLVRWLAGAILSRVLVLAVVAVGVFALVEAAPGDAADAYLAATGGGDAAFAARLRETLGLGEGLVARFLAYAGGVVTLDLGTSAAFGRPVVDLLLDRLPNTLLLMGPAIALSAVLGVALGAVAARRPGGAVDGTLSAAVLVLNATPGFLLAILGVVLFAIKLRWLPTSGLAPPGRLPAEAPLDTLRHLVLPVATLALTTVALTTRVTRAALIEAARSGHVAAARSRGVGGWRLFGNHLARPALPPVLTLVGVQASLMLGGSVVVETVFAIPGFGSLAAQAVTARDTRLLAGIVLCGAAVVLLVNAFVDAAVALADPRVRLAPAR
jgi:peptide/nickel transport system permease protein